MAKPPCKRSFVKRISFQSFLAWRHGADITARMEFSSLPLSADFLDVLKELHFDKMTPVQAQAIPLLLEGRDLIGQSQTGSGKTAAFALPLLQKIRVEVRELQALVICPTRELCTQVAREIRKLGRRRQALQVLVVCGGQPIGPQISALRKGTHVVVGTPGRLVDLIHKSRLETSNIETLVLDEADRMLEMGFEDDMRVIMAEMPARRQTVLFSATFPDSIQSLSESFQQDPATVVIENSATALPAIEQIAFSAENEEKPTLLMRLLRKRAPEAALIFCNLKATTGEVGQFLQREGFSAEFLHGDLEQRERDEVLAKFRNGSIRFLVATDVAARGLDIASLPLVINYDLPQEAEVYVHRIGRTGRAGQSGVAISLVATHDQLKMVEIQRHTGLRFEPGQLGPRGEPQIPQPAAMQTLFIGGGRKDKVRPGDLLGALTGEAGGLRGTDVGHIEIHDRFSYVAVTRALAPTAFQRLSQGRIKGQRFHVKLLN